jgi:RNA polymerase sigma factor (sigma-70 family)
MTPSPSDVPIEVVGLSVRAYNCLRRAGIHTVGQLLAVTDEELPAIWQLGVGSLADIKQKLAEYFVEHPESALTASAAQEADLSSAGDQEVEDISSDSLILSFEVLSLSAHSSEVLRGAGCQTLNDVAAMVETGLPWSRRYFDQNSLTEIKTQLDALFARYPHLIRPISLQALDLSVRSYNALMRHGVYTVEKLAQLSDEELWNIRNIGAKAVAEINEKLGTYLKMYPECAQLGLRPCELEPLLPLPPPLSLADPDELAAVREKGIPLDEIVVERLALSELDQCLLRRADIRTIENLAQQPRDKWEQEKQISQRLGRYLNWLLEQDEALWADEVDDLGISPLIRLDLASGSLRDFVQEWLSPLNERERQIVEWRYGLYGARLTLEEAGERLGITRERVRQIEKGATKKLRYPSRQRCVLPLVGLLRQVVVQAGGLVTAASLGESLAAVVDVADIHSPGMARLLLATQSEFVEVKKIAAWALCDSPVKLIPEINRRLASILAAEYAPLCEGDLVSRLKATSWYQARADELSNEFILACLRASEAIVCCDGDSYGLERWDRHYQDDIVVALRCLGQPTHYSDIAKAINEGLPPERHITPRAVHIRLMQNSELFTWVGLRGTYGLKEWGVERALTYEDALAQILEEASHPMTYQEILAQMPKFRPYYDENSLVLTLGTNGRFRPFPGDTFGLVEWREEDFTEDYRLQRLFDEIEAVPSVTKLKTQVVEALDSVDGFIARARERTDHGR